MTTQAEALGFKYNRKGCPCNGSPAIYIKEIDTIKYTLTIWEKRNMWRLTKRACLLLQGNRDNLTTKIQEIWDLSKN